MKENKLTVLQKLTTKYKRKFHFWPFIFGIVGNILVATAIAVGGVPEDFPIPALYLLTLLGVIMSIVSWLIPLAAAIVFLLLSLIYASAFLATIDGFGLIASLVVFIASVMCFRLRKDLLKKWGWQI